MSKKLIDAAEAEIRRFLESSVEVKAAGETYSMVISKEVPDRDGDVVVLSGMDATAYRKNPVVLVDHDYRVESIVGKTVSIETVGTELVAKFVFCDTEYGLLAKSLYEAGFLKTSSIGFILKERDPNDRGRITKWELLEWSLVAVPCNRDALSLDGKALYAKGIEAGMLTKDCADGCGDDEEEPEIDVKAAFAEIRSAIASLASAIEEIKSNVKSLADRKAQETTEEEAKARKEVLQTINRATSEALAGLKRL